MHKTSIVTTCLLIVGFWLGAEPLSDAALRKSTQRIHARSILVDGHNDITVHMSDAGYDIGEPSAGLPHTALARLKQGGVIAQFFSVWIDPDAFATTVADIRRAKRQERVAALIGIEGGYAIENSLETLRAFHRLRVRYMTLTHRRSTDWAGAAINGLRRAGLAAMDSAAGAVRDWDPNPDFWLQKLLFVNDVFYPGGGVFFRIDGQTGRGIAAFSLSSGDPPLLDTTSLPF